MLKRGALALVALGAALALCLRPVSELADRPLTEDAYYSLAVARHLALGHGFSVDGVHATNGVQPLFTLLCALPAWLSGADRLATIRSLLLLSFVVFAASGFVFAKIVQRLAGTPSAFVSGFTAYAGSMFAFWQHFNGLETGLTLLAYLVCWWWFLRGDFTRRAHALVLGGLLGALVLTRIDAAFFVVVMTAVLAFARRLPGAGSRLALTVSLTSALVSSPWWLYGLVKFGSLMPSSGAAQQALGLSAIKIFGALHALALCLAPTIYLFGEANVVKTALYALAFGSSFLLFRRLARPELDAASGARAVALARSRYFALALGAACAFFVVWYTYTSGAVHFYRRYFAPLSLLALTMVAITVDALGRRSRWWGGLALLAVGAPSALLALALLSSSRLRPPNTFLTQVELVERHVPHGEKVGAFQSGTLGYFRDGVINLDGKVNAEAIRNRSHLSAYIDAQGIGWLCDWPEMLTRLDKKPEQLGFELVDRENGMVLYARARRILR